MFELGVEGDYCGVATVAKVGDVGSTERPPCFLKLSLSHSLARSLWFGKGGSWAMAEGRIFGGSSRIPGGFSGC